MKVRPFASSITCCLVFMGCSAAVLAQEKTAPPEAKPGGDPFVKKKGEAPAQKEKPEEDSADILAVQEVFALPQDDFQRLIESGADSGDLYQQVEKLKTTGKVTLESVMAVTTRRGQRALVQQADEVRYATEWCPPQTEDGFPFPTAWEMRPVGQRMEVEPVESPDGKFVDLSLTSSVTRLAGFTETYAEPARRRQGQVQVLPRFESRELTTAVSAWYDRPKFIGTLSRPFGIVAEDEGKVRMAFLRMHAVQIPKPAKDLPNGPLDMRITMSVYSMERDEADALLKTVTDGEALHAAVTAPTINLISTQKDGEAPQTAVISLAGAPKAKLERVLSCVTRSGQRVRAQENEELRYGTEANPPMTVEQQKSAQDASNKTSVKGQPNPPVITGPGRLCPSEWTAFETRRLGWALDVDPELKPSGIVALDMAPEFTRLMGNLAGHDTVEKRDPPTPVFESQKIATVVRALPGKHAFMGTISPPQNTNVNGNVGDGRVWLAFILVTLD